MSSNEGSEYVVNADRERYEALAMNTARSFTDEYRRSSRQVF